MKALKKHGGLEEEVAGYQSVVTGLQKQADSLVSGDHFDSANITARQVGGAVVNHNSLILVSLNLRQSFFKY